MPDRNRKRPLKTLLMDNSGDDARLLEEELRYSGFEPEIHRVESLDAFRRALEDSGWDIILCDYDLAGTDTSGALQIYRKANLDIPFLVVARGICEDGAAALMKAGVHHFFLKDHLSRLVVGIERELREVDIRAANRRTEARIHESESRFQEMADTAPVILWTTDVNGVRNYVNRQWVEHTGQALDAREPEAWTRLIHPDDLSERTRLWDDAFAARRPYQSEFRLRRYDGNYRWFISRGSPRYSEQGGFAGYIGTSTDVGAVKDAEAALRKHNERLQRLAFIASHDMREPLRTVAIYTQLLDRRYREQLDDSAREFMGYVTAGVERIGKLMDDLLVYAEANFGDQHRALLSLDGPRDAALQNLFELLRQAGAEVHCDPLPTVHADARQMTLVFQNLIANAIKFRASRPLRIEILAARQDREWLISISDNGIGIAPEYRLRVFELFKRLHGPQYSGTGLGLTLCQAIIENHGGRIWTSGNEEGGSTFWFTLPAA